MSQQETLAQRAAREALERRLGIPATGPNEQTGGLYQTDEFPQGVSSENFLPPPQPEPQAAMPQSAMPRPTMPPPLPGLSFSDPGPLVPSGPEAEGPDLNLAPLDVKKKLGFLGRIKQQPGGTQALLAFGAGLMSGGDFFSALGKGSMAYQQTLDDAKKELQPKLTKDGTFTYQLDADGNAVFKRTPVADYEEQQTDKKLRTTLAGITLRDEGQTTRAKLKIDSDEKMWAGDQEFSYAELTEKGRWQDASNLTDIEIANITAAAARDRAQIASGGASGKPPPASVLKIFDEHTQSLTKATSTLGQGAKVIASLENGTLELGPIANILNKGGNLGILPSASSRAYGELTQFTQSLVNAILIDNKGVQTDGDAVRAKIETLVSSGDEVGAMTEIENALRMIERGRAQREQRARNIAQQYGIQDDNFNPASSAPAARAPAKRQTTRTGVGWRIVD